MSGGTVGKRDAKIPGKSLKPKEAEQEYIENKTEINRKKTETPGKPIMYVATHQISPFPSPYRQARHAARHALSGL